MTTYLKRYQDGDCDAVWQELIELGDAALQPPILNEATACIERSASSSLRTAFQRGFRSTPYKSLNSLDVDVPDHSNGVLYELAGFSGGIACYVKDGFLCYEFNLFEIQRTRIESRDKLPTGQARIGVESKLVGKIGGPTAVTLGVNGEDVAQGRVPAAMSLHFTSNATFDIAVDLDSPVSLDYYYAPFAFNGKIRPHAHRLHEQRI